MPPSVTKKVSLEAARRVRMTRSIADMFVQDQHCASKRRRPKRSQPREHSQVVRIRENDKPVRAFFQEPFIRPSALQPLQRFLNVHIFHDLDDMVDGLTPGNAFTRAVRFIFKLNFDRGPDEYPSGIGKMWEALAIPGTDAAWLYRILDGVQPIHKAELDRLLTGGLPLIQEYNHELRNMWAYGEVARSGGLMLTNIFSEPYAPAVRLAMMMEHLTGLSFVDGMFQKAERLRTLNAYALDLGFDAVSQDVFREAHGYQRTHFDRVEDGWVRYFLGRGNYLHASSLVAKKGRRLLRLSREGEGRDLVFNACTEFWRAADIARFGADHVQGIGDRMRLLRLSRAHMRDVVRLMQYAEQPKRRGARLRKSRREDRVYSTLDALSGSIHELRSAGCREQSGSLVNQMPYTQAFGSPASVPAQLFPFPEHAQQFTILAPLRIR